MNYLSVYIILVILKDLWDEYLSQHKATGVIIQVCHWSVPGVCPDVRIWKCKDPGPLVAENSGSVCPSTPF